jgi:hypothetical protein
MVTVSEEHSCEEEPTFSSSHPQQADGEFVADNLPVLRCFMPRDQGARWKSSPPPPATECGVLPQNRFPTAVTHALLGHAKTM